MSELLDVIDAFSTPLKIGWVVWAAWGIGQIFWYRHERAPRPASRATAPPRRRPVESDTPPLVTRLVTPDQMADPAGATAHEDSTPEPAVAVESVARPTSNLDLDSFVADFERMNTSTMNGGSHHMSDRPGRGFDEETHAR